MKNNSPAVSVAVILILISIFACANSLSPKSSPNVTVVGRRAYVPEGSTLVLYYSSRLYFITSAGDEVTVSIKTSSKTYNLPKSDEITKVPLVSINTVDVKKVKNGIEVTWPWYMINK